MPRPQFPENFLIKNLILQCYINGSYFITRLSLLPKLFNKMCLNFKDCGLSKTVTTNITSVDFLDLILNFKTESYQLFRKLNNDLIYIDINSNHPPQILKQLPKSISKRLSENSSPKEVLDKTKTLYEKSLNNSGFYDNLTYHQGNGNKNQHKTIKKRHRKIVWFNPPFSKIVKTLTKIR